MRSKRNGPFYGFSRLTALAAAALVLASHPACAGTATASITVDGQTFAFSGGECVRSGGMFAVNIGTHSSRMSPGPHPDYFGMTIPEGSGDFSDGAVSFTKDGISRSIGAASGTATPSGAAFSGRLMRGGGLAKGSFSC